MFEDIIIKYFNPGLNIGMQDIRNVWLLEKKPIKLIATLHRGNLVFRIPGTRKRVSYKRFKIGLIKKQIIIKQPVYLLPF
jgi:hypothetical protein